MDFEGKKMTELKMILFTILICVGVPSVYSRNIIAFTTREGDLNHIVVHNRTGRIYVGAVNGIFQFTSDMNYEFEYKTGPQLENVKCLPEQECAFFPASKDNVNKILQIDYDKQLLLACGSAIQGTCTIHSLDVINPIEDHVYSPDNIEYDFVATEGSVVGFFGPAPTNPQNQDSSLGLYVGATHQTERPSEYITQKAVSTKRLHLTNGRYNFQYAFYDDLRHTYIDFLSDYYANTYKINYVHGFSQNGFSYFLTVQRTSVSATNYHTRVVRICQNDIGYYSYTELPLKCENENRTRNYNILQAAYVGPVGSHLAEYLNIKNNDVDTDVILGVFADSENRTTDLPTRNTAVCAFTMKMLATKFRKGIQNCFDGQDSQGLDFFSQDVACMQSGIEIDNSFCGHGINSPIEITRSYNAIDLLQGGGRMVPLSSINAMVFDRRTIAVMGTKDGELLHYILRPRNEENLNPPPPETSRPGPVAPYRNQTMDPPGPIIQDMPYTLDMQNILVGTPKTLFKVPIHDCSQYHDCSTCVTTEDPMVCGWCGTYCSTSNECSGTGVVWNQMACPPAIHSISPISGPLGGGTVLTITGDNLGIGIIMTGGTHSIHLPGGVNCIPIPEKSNIQKITCNTTEVEEPTKGVISINVNVNSELIPYSIVGIATSSMQFSYVDPVIDGFYPPYGPLSGGTSLSIFGSYLLAGNSQQIQIAGLECTISRTSDSEITCITEAVPNMESLSSKIFMTFDTYTVKYSSDDFHYVDDPVIYDIQPRTSILSGGLPLNVIGSNLHVIMEPMIVVTVYLGTEFRNFESPCTPNLNGSLMLCNSPDISSTQVETPYVVDVAFILDNVDNAMQYSNSTGNDTQMDFDLMQLTYVVNPIYYEFDDENGVRQLKDSSYPLEIMGNHLNLVATANDVQVIVHEQRCNVTQLSYTVLKCQPPTLQEHPGQAYPVSVTVGNLHYEVGSLEFFEADDNSPEYWHYILITASSCIVIFVIFLVLIMLYKRRLRTKYLEQNEPTVHYRPESYRVDPTTSNTYTENPSFRQREKKPLLSLISAEMRLQIEEILIPEDNFVIENIIGKGHFGSVYQGSHKTKSGEVNEVAIKCLLPGSSQQEMVHFLEEGMMMKDFKHENVLALIGVCINKDGVPLVILPFMKHGDLLTYIRDPQYELTARELLTFGLHIARGMAYLASLKFVHRDLAARNCMLDGKMTVKVADFGLSRDIYERDYYSAKDKNAKLPIRWMALECLERNIYNTKTDVWSFGVVLWEMLTRGITPYPAVDNWDINRYLSQGRRLPQPQFCPDEVYHVMQQCWSFNPQSRPNFDELAIKLAAILESSQEAPTTQDTYVYVNVPRNESYTLATKSDAGASPSFIPDGYMSMAGAKASELEEEAPIPYVETPVLNKLPSIHNSTGKQDSIQEDVQGYLQVSPR